MAKFHCCSRHVRGIAFNHIVGQEKRDASSVWPSWQIALHYL